VRISWDDGLTPFEGVYQAVLYPQNSPGVAWNGLTSVVENGDNQPDEMYIDGQKIANHIVPSPLSGTIAAFMWPDEFEPYNGIVSGLTAQPRQTFGLCYRDNRELHIVYNVLVKPSTDKYASLADDISPVNFAWDFTSTPVGVTAAKATSHMVIDLDNAPSGAISDLEDLLYGDDSNDPSLPDPDTIVDLFESYATLRVTDNGDGTWTATGPDSAITVTGDTFTIDWPSAMFLDADSYRIYSL
jgi:hypothetical protein